MRARGRDRSLKRRPGRRPGRRVLIVCEGQTERSYFEGLRRVLQSPGVQVELVDDAGSAPISVVDRALEERKFARRDREDFDSVWCIFDMDQHESFHRAINKADANGLNLAVSVVCFEFWVLLHYADTSRPFEDCASVLSEVKKKVKAHGGSYEKARSLEGLLACRKEAILRAKRLATMNERSNPEERWPNPSTTVHELVEFLESLIPYEIPA